MRAKKSEPFFFSISLSLKKTKKAQKSSKRKTNPPIRARLLFSPSAIDRTLVGYASGV